MSDDQNQPSNAQQAGPHKCVIISDFIRDFRTKLNAWPPPAINTPQAENDDITKAFSVLFMKLKLQPPPTGGIPGSAQRIASDLVTAAPAPAPDTSWPFHSPVPVEWSNDPKDAPAYHYFEISFIIRILLDRSLRGAGGNGPKGSPPPPPDSN